MPTLSVIGVLVSKLDWMLCQFADGTRSEPCWIKDAEDWVNLAHNLDAAAWVAFQEAIINRDKWIDVKGN